MNLEELSELLKSVTLDDKIGHLFTVDIKFSDINPKTLLFNEIYPSIFEKNKKNLPHGRSTVQIMSRTQEKKKKEEISALPFNAKTHSTLKEKILVTLYAEDFFFLTTRAGWKVTKMYDHYTFKQERFKGDFLVMNQNACKLAKTKVEKDFYKPLNNSNFGNDCRNNIGNCKLELMFDGLEEIAYIKKYTNIMLDNTYREFFSLDLLRQQVQKEFKKKKEKLDKSNPFYMVFYKF